MEPEYRPELTAKPKKNATPFEKEFAQRLTLLFELSGKNRAHVAKEWRCEPQWLYRMQAGHLPSISFLIEKICPTFSVEPGFFLDRMESNHPDILRIRSMTAAQQMIKGQF